MNNLTALGEFETDSDKPREKQPNRVGTATKSSPTNRGSKMGRRTSKTANRDIPKDSPIDEGAETGM
jgi:hypothetical protein